MTDKMYFRNWRAAGMGCAALTLLLGATGLAGWINHEPVLRRFFASGTEMKFNTALGITLLGMSLLLSFHPRKVFRMGGMVLAGALFLLAGVTLGECVSGFNAGIDELFFKDTNLFRTSAPGRMAAQSAMTLILLAVGIYFTGSRSWRRRALAQGITLLSLFFPAQALVGYALGKMAIAGISPESSYMAIPTALGFISAALALLLRTPTESLMSSLTARTPASIVFRRQLICAIFLPIILGMLVLRMAGNGGGAQSAEYCIATFALVIIFVFVALTWINAAQLNAAAHALARVEAIRALLASITQDLMQLQTVDEITRAVGAKIGGHLKLSICCFVEINEAADVSHVTHEWRRDASVPSLLGTYKLAEYFSADFQKVLRAGREFVVNDTETDPRTDAKNYRALQLRSFVCVPLVRAGEWKFMFDVHDSTPHDWQADEIELVREITARLWTRLERAHADETLQKKERELQTANKRLQLATKAAGIGAFEWNIPADVNYWTPELEALYGLPPGGFTGRNGHDWAAYLHPEDREQALAAALQAIERRTEFNTEFRIVWPDGTVRWLAGRAQVVCDEAGEPERMIGVNIDITGEKQSQAMLRQNESLFAALVEQAPTGLYVVDSQFRLQQVNARALPVFARVAPLIGRDFTEVMQILWGPEVGGEVVKIFRRTLDTGEPYVSPRFTNQRQDLGVEESYEWETQRVTLPDGQHGVVCYFNDVTERERAVAALRNSEALYRTIGESINYGVWVCEPDGRNTYASESFLKLVGLTQEQCSNFGWGEVLHPDDVQPTIAAWEECVRTGNSWDREHRFKGVDGQWHYILARGLPVKDGAGKITSWAGINLDVTGRKAAEKALIESTERFRLLTEVVEMQVWTANLGGELDYANQECVKYFEADLARDILGNAWAQFVHPDDVRETIQRWQHSLTTGENYETEFRLRSKSGEYRWFLVRAKSLRDDADGISKWLGTNTDIHALKTAEQKAVQASRAKDDFLAALSHELRTPLNPALLIASEAADNPQLPEPTRQNFKTIRKNIELEARLIDDLLDLTRITAGKLALEKWPMDVHAVLMDAIATIQSEQQTKEVHLARNLGAGKMFVTGDAVRLQQVFWNVLKNAVKFTPKDGAITVETFIQGACVNIKISDTGIGMNPDELARVFNAFAQGDHAGGGGSHRFGGLGLGLAISKNLVELHGGEISAASNGPNLGSTFLIKLQLAPEVTTESLAVTRAASNGSPKTFKADAALRSILLVEDHEPTRTVLSHLLQRRKFQVTAAASLAEARALAGQNKFDLLISDIGLPDGNGNDLMNELRELYGLRGIALSGYGMEEDIARGKAAGFVTHLTKPVRIESLENALSLLKKTGGQV